MTPRRSRPRPARRLPAAMMLALACSDADCFETALARCGGPLAEELDTAR